MNLKYYILLFLIPFALSVFGQGAEQNTTLQMVSNGIVTFSGSNPYTATVSLQNDLTGNNWFGTSFLTGTPTAYRVFTSDGNIWQVTAVSGQTFTSVDITVIPYGATPTQLPTGSLLIWQHNGLETVPYQPTGPLGTSDVLQSAIATYNSQINHFKIYGEFANDIDAAGNAVPVNGKYILNSANTHGMKTGTITVRN